MQGISDYLKQHYPQYRQPTIRKLYEIIRSLREAPYRGRPGNEEGTREVCFPPLPYVAVYRVNERQQTVEVLRVYHGAQDGQCEPERRALSISIRSDPNASAVTLYDALTNCEPNTRSGNVS